MYTQFESSVFSPRVIKENNNEDRLDSLELQDAQTYFDIGYNVFDLHDAFKVFEVLAITGIDIKDVIQDTNGDSSPDSGYSIRELFEDSDGGITIEGINDATYNVSDNGLKYHYTITAIINSLGFKPVMTIMGITNADLTGTIYLPQIPQSSFNYNYGQIQPANTLIHLRNSENHKNGADRGLMDLQLDVSLYSAIYFKNDGTIIDINDPNNSNSVGNDTSLQYYFPALKLKEFYNYSFDILTGPGGYASAELLLSNRTAEELFRAGVVITPGIVVLFSFEQLRAAGYSEAAITASQSQEITARDLLGLGFDICDLNTFNEVNRTWSRFETPKPSQTTPEYLAELQMRRKAETLKHNNNAIIETSKERLKNILKGRKSPCTRGITFTSTQSGETNANSLQLPRVNNTLILSKGGEPTKSTPKPAYFSGVPGNKLLYLDKSIPLFNYKRKYTYDDN